jgi:hypothetical protein
MCYDGVRDFGRASKCDYRQSHELDPIKQTCIEESDGNEGDGSKPRST